MRRFYAIACLLSLTCLSGCRNDIWYAVRTKNLSNDKMYECRVAGWPYRVVWGGVNPGTGGGVNAGCNTPVPDEIVITWKTIRPGQEVVLKQYEEELERVADEWAKATENFTKDVPYPSIEEPEGIFDDHRVVLVLKDKVPKRPVNGEIVITYLGNEQFEVQYVQKKQ